MPTDTKLNNLIINYLTQAQYDAIQTPNENELYLTPDNSTGGGGGGNSLTLELTDFSTGEPITRTSITEEEKTNLEEGKYGFISYYDTSWSEDGSGEMMATLPQLFKNFMGSYTITVFSGYMSNNSFVISGLLPYFIEIGEKNTDGTYPITITKGGEVFFGGGSGAITLYEHTITIKNSAGAILWTQTMRNSKDTVVNSYTNLKTLFGKAIYAGYGEYAQLDLSGGTEATDKLIKLDGTEATLASLGAIVYTDVCFLPK